MLLLSSLLKRASKAQEGFLATPSPSLPLPLFLDTHEHDDGIFFLPLLLLLLLLLLFSRDLRGCGLRWVGLQGRVFKNRGLGVLENMKCLKQIKDNREEYIYI